MAYATGTASSISDLVSVLCAFAITEGWTQDHLDTGAGKAAIHKGTVYVSFRWATASPTSIAVYHALGFISTATDPGNHTNDSGVGTVSGTNANITDSRGMNSIGNGPFTRYHFFSNATDIKVVLEFSPGLYRHMGFGIIDKLGDWTGGEFCYGHNHTNTSPTSTFNTCLFDGLVSLGTDVRSASIHAEGFPNMNALTKWCTENMGTADGVDRAGNPNKKFIGGFRGGTLASAFGWLVSDLDNGYLPLRPIPAFFWDRDPTPDEVIFMGFLKDIRAINITAFSPADEVTVGADTWKMFPTVRKQHQVVTEESRNQGIAYRIVP